MPQPNQIKKQEQKIARLEKSLAVERLKKRKADTRRKIEFGGLVIKAGMGDFTKDVILGALIKAKQTIENEEGYKSILEAMGEQAFLEKGLTDN